MAGFLDLEGFYRDGEFESKIKIKEDTEGYIVNNVEFARMNTPEDFDACGRMMIEVSKLLTKLNGE